MCKRFMVVILVLGVLFAPSLAFADDFGGSDGGDFSDQVIYGPNVLNIQSGTYGVQVYAGNKFNAALCVLGFDGNDSRFTDDVKAYLSNESTGGSFYEFSNLFTNNNSPNISGFDAYNISFTSAIGTNNTVYGAEFVWIAQYTDTLRQAAYARVEEVLDGNVGGGGTTIPSEIGTYILKFTNSGVTLKFNRYYDFAGVTYRPNECKYGGVTYARSVTDIPFKFTNTTVLNLLQDTTLKVYIWGNDAFSSSGSASKNLKVMITDDVPMVTTNQGSYSGNTWSYDTYTFTRHEGKRYYYNSNVNVGERDGYLYTTNIISADTTFTSIDANIPPNGNGTNIPFCMGDSGTEPVVPPTQWPEPDPVTPTEPPEVPTPTPTDPPVEPTSPQFGIPQLPSIGLTTEPTYQTADLAAVLDAMAKHCQHLQTCMTECFDSYYSAITQYEKSIQENQKEFLRSWFRVTLDTIRDCFDDLSDYLQRLFTWLADQMDFTFTGGDFDDSSIVWWLKRIYSKLGSGTTVRPTDPVVDPKGIGDWFDQLIKNFVLDLLALGQDFLADVVEMFRQLTTKFPISIPWDIVAILTLFAAEPETPVFNIPQYALTGTNTISQVGTYVIDMQDYDGVMSVVRNVEKVVFAFWLCWKIDFFKQAFDIMTGGK